jgi:uncharacterized protein
VTRAAERDKTSLVDLKKKLARLGTVASSREPERERTLDALRGKMEEILGRAPPPSPARADPSATALPFVQKPERGELHIRRERLEPSRHVGRMPLSAAASADPAMLALLGLDPTLGACDFRRALYLDTETTGLGGGAGILAFLIGLAWFDDEGRLAFEQLLLTRPADEPAMLELVSERLERASVLVTYNGKAFDAPLIAGRFVMNHLPPPARLPHFDLLHVARRLHKPRLGACRLVGLESDVLGFVRGDDIAGADVAPRYAHFLRTGDESALSAVVEHNALDVLSMVALVGLYGEPLGVLHDADLVGLARTLKRAGALEQAARAANMAVERGAGAPARRARGAIAKALGDRARALSDFEALAREVDDPAVRLELAKLYEHHVRAPARALEVVRQGTGERAARAEKRRARLERKIARAKAPKPGR